MSTEARSMREATVASRYIRCYNPKCRAVIGFRMRPIDNDENVHKMIRCPGKGNHPEPRRYFFNIRWGVIETHYLYYAETETIEQVQRFVGYPHPLVFLFAAMCVARHRAYEPYKRIFVGEKQVEWTFTFRDLALALFRRKGHDLTDWKKRSSELRRDVTSALLKQKIPRSQQKH